MSEPTGTGPSPDERVRAEWPLYEVFVRGLG